MLGITRRSLFKATAGATAGFGSLVTPWRVRSQGKEEFRLKLGTDLPVAHPVNVRLQEAIKAIGAETDGRVAILLFPNNQLGSDSDMLSQIRSGALELQRFAGHQLHQRLRRRAQIAVAAVHQGDRDGDEATAGRTSGRSPFPDRARRLARWRRRGLTP